MQCKARLGLEITSSALLHLKPPMYLLERDMYLLSCTTEAFISPYASTSPPITSSQPSISRCSRRQAIKYATLSLISAVLLPQSTEAVDVFGVGDAIPSDDFERVRSSVKSDVSFADFVQSIRKGDVKKVWFFGAFKEYCCFEASDGVLRHVGEGYPVESSRSPESPMHVIAKVRDNNIPYYVAPLSAKFLRR